MTARHRRTRHWSLAIGALALALAAFGTGSLHGVGIGHADAIGYCTEAR